MFARYQKFEKRPLGERLRFLFTGRYWLRVDHDQLGQPTSVAVGFVAPDDVVTATPAEMEQLQQQIAANQRAFAAEQQAREAKQQPPVGRAARREGKRR